MKNLPVFEKDGVKYYPCPECGGHGEVMYARLYPTGHKECWDPCGFCDSEGYFAEEDYLVMKLAGEI